LEAEGLGLGDLGVVVKNPTVTDGTAFVSGGVAVIISKKFLRKYSGTSTNLGREKSSS